MMDAHSTCKYVAEFLRSYPNDFCFPLGENIEIPMPSEEIAFGNLPFVTGTADLDTVLAIRSTLTVRMSYALLSFAVRSAVLAVRRRSSQLLRSVIPLFVIDDDQVDWRDVITALSIVDDCAERLSMDLSSEIRPFIAIGTGCRQDTILNGYLARTLQMRKIGVFGFEVKDGPSGIVYVRKGAATGGTSQY
jgi:hypothetical protein